MNDIIAKIFDKFLDKILFINKDYVIVFLTCLIVSGTIFIITLAEQNNQRNRIALQHIQFLQKEIEEYKSKLKNLESKHAKDIEAAQKLGRREAILEIYEKQITVIWQHGDFRDAIVKSLQSKSLKDDKK